MILMNMKMIVDLIILLEYTKLRELANKKPPVGLLNHGVTCYMNSAIQSIIHIPAMQHYLNDVNDNNILNLNQDQ